MPVPRLGDVLVSNRTATLEHGISIVPDAPHLTCPTYRSALERGRELASELGVDAWLTEDHIHYLLIQSCRRPATEPARDASASC